MRFMQSAPRVAASGNAINSRRAQSMNRWVEDSVTPPGNRGARPRLTPEKFDRGFFRSAEELLHRMNAGATIEMPTQISHFGGDGNVDACWRTGATADPRGV